MAFNSSILHSSSDSIANIYRRDGSRKSWQMEGSKKRNASYRRQITPAIEQMLLCIAEIRPPKTDLKLPAFSTALKKGNMTLLNVSDWSKLIRALLKLASVSNVSTIHCMTWRLWIHLLESALIRSSARLQMPSSNFFSNTLVRS